MNEPRKFAIDVSWSFLGSLVAYSLSLAVSVILARYYGAANLGLYSLTMTLYAFIWIPASLGIASATIQFAAINKTDQSKLNEVGSSAAVASLVLGIAVSAALVISSTALAALFHQPNLATFLVVLSPIFPFYLVGNALQSFLNGIRKMRYYALASIFQNTLALVLALVVLSLGFGALGVVFSQVLAAAGYCLLLVYVCRDYFSLTLNNLKEITKDQISLGSRIMLASSVNLIGYQIDILLVGYFLTVTQVGYYAVAVALSTFFWIVPQSVQQVTYPAISEYWVEKNISAIQRVVTKSITYCTVVLVPLGLGVTFFSRYIVLILGSAFANAIIPALILLLATIINGALQRPIGSILYSLGFAGLNLQIFSIAAAANVVLNVLLIPRIGISGASLATVVSYTFITGATLFYTQKITGIAINFKWIAKIGAVASIVVVAYVLVGPMNNLNNLVLGSALIIAFVVAEWSFFLSRDDKAFMKDISRAARNYVYSR